MRLKRSRVRTYFHKIRTVKKDKEGSTYEEYGNATSFQGEVWPASGKVQAAMYGDKLSYIRNIKIAGTYETVTDSNGKVHYVYPGGLDITESDGLCLYVTENNDPDYKIISIKPYQPLRLEAERL
ncbi:Uncharacterised protein [[Eubacterium] contortum]|uniref:Uncharacterized protein n=1 Tax=Faecalicatena contorta TaxID=39482 RepID=A0A174LLP7_9FIRM|nr:hypothetical protein [Faecalicatena contorta]CUP25063.1 Uncharacterised protein [[Eubacterium] contortum] [Faecalicatena contorta]